MDNIIAFPNRKKLDIKEDYTWLQLWFADSTDTRIVHISGYSFGGDGEWHFLPTAVIEDLESNKAHLYFYDKENDKFFFEGSWDFDDECDWCWECNNHIMQFIASINPDKYEVEITNSFIGD